MSKFFRSKSERKDSILTVIQCFGGGILLGTSLIILLPEVINALFVLIDFCPVYNEFFTWSSVTKFFDILLEVIIENQI